METKKAAEWAQILALPFGMFCAYGVWVQLQATKQGGSPQGGGAVTAGFTLARLFNSTAVLIALGAFAGLLLLSIVLFALSRRAPMGTDQKAKPVADRPYPTVTIFKHAQAQQDMFLRVMDRFAESSWHVVPGTTELPQHASGIWIRGGSSFEREMAKWGLDGLDVEWKPDYKGDPPATLQVIVGAYEARKREPNELTGAELTERLREGQAIREYPAVVSERDSLKVALEETQHEREAIRGTLTGEITTLKNNLDGMEQAWLTSKRNFALARINWFAEQTRIHSWPFFTVTVRFAEYNNDYAIAQKIESILKEQTKWARVDIDGGNRPVLRPDPKFKVVFVQGADQRFDPLIAAFIDGKFLECSVGQRIIQTAGRDLVIEVLPTVNG